MAIGCNGRRFDRHTAVSGEGYFIDTTSATHTVTLPASPSLGDFIGVIDVANQFSSNSVTIARNGSKINGDTSDVVISAFGANRTFVYSGSTYGWVTVNEDGTDPTYITGTGGTETTSGDFKIHTFNSSANFVVSCVGNTVAGGGDAVSYLVVAGGGGRHDGGGAGVVVLEKVKLQMIHTKITGA